MVEENNEIYYLQYSILTDSIYINRFNINVKYRNKKYSYKIINDLITILESVQKKVGLDPTILYPI